MKRLVFLVGVVIALAGGGVIVEALMSAPAAHGPGARDGMTGGVILAAFGLALAWFNRPGAMRRSPRGAGGLNPHMWSDAALGQGSDRASPQDDNADSSVDNGDSGGDPGGDSADD